MFLSLTDFFNDESSVIQVDSSGLDVSEFSDEADQAFLITHGHEILRIRGKAEFAKAQIAKMIDARAEDAQGKLIYEIQERFRNTPELKGGLLRYFHSLGFWNAHMEKMGLDKPQDAQSLDMAFRWANAYRAALEMQTKLDGLLTPEEIQAKASSLSALAAHRIITSLAEKDREEVYMRLAQGEEISQSIATEICKDPEKKLNKAKELLEEAKERAAAAKERWEEVKADPQIPATVNGKNNPEYDLAQQNARSAISSVANYEKKIADLEAQLAQKDTELDKFKFDDETRREQRIKSLMAGLTIGVPQTIADLQKYFTEAEYYPDRIRTHLNDQVKMLADMCGDYLARN